jgi:hypothetical protein
VVVDRWMSKVDKTDTCWLWTAAKTPRGYGQFWHDGQMRPAYRVGYELLVGPVPEGVELDHLCRVPACVNPDHLDPVTHQVNMQRAPQPTLCPRGHDNWKKNYRGHRICHTCKMDEQSKRRARQKVGV